MDHIILKDILVSLNFFNHLKDKNFFIIEDFKHPNYYEYNKDINHILLDQVLENLKKKLYSIHQLWMKKTS